MEGLVDLEMGCKCYKVGETIKNVDSNFCSALRNKLTRT